MANDINSITLTGRLTKDIEAKEAGKSHVCNGSIAVNRSQKKGDTWEDIASFINIRVWASSPKQLEYYQSALKKGTAVTVHGQLITDTYEKDGKKNTFTYVLCDIIKPSLSNGSKPTNTNGNGFNPSDGFPEDVPF